MQIRERRPVQPSVWKQKFFVEAYPIKKKSDASEGLDMFVREYGAPDKLVYDGGTEQVGLKTKFQLGQMMSTSGVSPVSDSKGVLPYRSDANEAVNCIILEP